MGSENIESRQIITEQACPCQTLLGTPWVQSQDQQLRPCQSPQHLELFCKQLCHPLPCLHQRGEQQRLLAWSPVSSSVTLSLVSTSAGSSRGSWPGLPGCLSLQSRGHNLWGKVEVVTQVLDTLVGEVPVVMAPGKLLLHVSTRLQ